MGVRDGPLGPLGFNSPNIAQRHALHVGVSLGPLGPLTFGAVSAPPVNNLFVASKGPKTSAPEISPRVGRRDGEGDLPCGARGRRQQGVRDAQRARGSVHRRRPASLRADCRVRPLLVRVSGLASSDFQPARASNPDGRQGEKRRPQTNSWAHVL